MQVRLLGTAAGGGFPQWNCGCVNCEGVRRGTIRARPRTQSCVAVSADGRRWFLLNASPDVRVQIESFAPLLPRGSVRGTGIQGIVLTNADLDHTLGLLVLREGGRLSVHATSSVRRALDEGLHLSEVLDRYGGVDWRQPPTSAAPLACADGTLSGLSYAAFPVPGKLPRYREGRASPSGEDTVGYQLVDESTGKRLVYVPGLAALDRDVLTRLQTADVVLLDGTFWSDDEMRTAGAGSTSAREMGHLPVGSEDGSLTTLASLPAARKIYVHINNTNPILREDSPERQAVENAGVEVGWDGMEFTL
ncbi:MAG TPA: pyrroloquinoline quinone biosynthesis protein PqqB [Gemmataceae bacterium]|nr:pyrroloquinoline quinone biosynthesis protein PqqB [Gemmataceae bacterium]